VVLRVACRVCLHKSAYRLVRLVAKFGPEMTLGEVLHRFCYHCARRAEARSKGGMSSSGLYLPEIEHPKPPDTVKLRLLTKD